MDISDTFSSQEYLPLSQESFKYLWQEWNEQTNMLNMHDAVELKCLIKDDNFCQIENPNQLERSSDNIIVPASTSSDMRIHTDLNIPASGIAVPTTNEYFAGSTAVSQQINGSNIPPSTDWPGDYDFKISFQLQEKATKSTSWIYSEMKEKLYVNMAVACPVNFHVKTKPPPGSFVRAMAIFSQPEHITDIVRRCLNHSYPTDASNDGHPAPEHLIRCDNSSSQYMEDRVTKRQSVIVPYEDPQVGMEYTTYLYRFMCLGSCVGGLNRRPLKLIFALEKDGHCLGRKVVDLRICACPGRDKRTDEKHQLKRSSNHSKTNLDSVSGPPLKKQKSDSDEESHFILIINQRSHYELLKKLRDALEFSSMLTPEQSLALRQKHMRLKKNRRENHQSSEDSST